MTKNKAPTWKLERRAINSLTPFEHNPRIIKGKPFEDLKKSIEKFGMVQPLAITIEGTIIGGHARYFYLKDRGDEWVDCFVPDRVLTLEEVKECNIRLNKNVAGEFDFEVLANYFDTSDLEAWGFEAKDFGIVPDDTGDDLGLSDEDKQPYQQITFTLHDTQHALVMDVLDLIKTAGTIADSPNENENGNALYTLCKQYQQKM